MMITNRRGFLAGTAALLTAPALVRASSLEYVPRARVMLPTFADLELLVFDDKGYFVSSPIPGTVKTLAGAVQFKPSEDFLYTQSGGARRFVRAEVVVNLGDGMRQSVEIASGDWWLGDGDSMTVQHHKGGYRFT